MSDKIEVILCGHSWGIGTYKYKNEEGQDDYGYGLYRPENPNDFTPDMECCSPEEIKAWETDLAAWNKGGAK